MVELLEQNSRSSVHVNLVLGFAWLHIQRQAPALRASLLGFQHAPLSQPQLFQAACLNKACQELGLAAEVKLCVTGWGRLTGSRALGTAAQGVGPKKPPPSWAGTSAKRICRPFPAWELGPGILKIPITKTFSGPRLTSSDKSMNGTLQEDFIVAYNPQLISGFQSQPYIYWLCNPRPVWASGSSIVNRNDNTTHHIGLM